MCSRASPGSSGHLEIALAARGSPSMGFNAAATVSADVSASSSPVVPSRTAQRSCLASASMSFVSAEVVLRGR